MVTEWGMSALGPQSFGKVEQEMILGREISKRVDYSEQTAQKIDAEIKSIITDCYNITSEIIRENIDVLHKIARRLLEKEVLDGSEIDKIIEEGAVA
jgi:cell division protease FtsH